MKRISLGRSLSLLPLSLLVILFSSCKEPIPEDPVVQNKINKCQKEHNTQPHTNLNGIVEDETKGNHDNQECEDLTPADEIHLNANLEFLNFSEELELKLKIDAIMDKTLKVLNSQEFQQAVYAHTYKEKQTFVQNQGKTNYDIYESLLFGLEVLDKDQSPDHEIDLQLKKYYKRSSTIGYTYPSSPIININLYQYRKMSEAQIAKNLIHEWTHKLGYKHDRNRTKRRKYSVPYGVGKIIENLYTANYGPFNASMNNVPQMEECHQIH